MLELFLFSVIVLTMVEPLYKMSLQANGFVCGIIITTTVMMKGGVCDGTYHARRYGCVLCVDRTA